MALRVAELRSTYGAGGGPDKTILLSAKSHQRTCFDVRCFYFRGRDDAAFSLGERARQLEVPFEEILEGGRTDVWRPMSALLRLLMRFRPHVIHAHDYKSDLAGLFCRPLLPKTALLATAHGWTLDSERMNLYNRLDHHILRYFDHCIAVSHATQQRLLEAGVRKERTSVLYNGIDVDAWSPEDPIDARRILHPAWHLPDKARVVGLVGRLSPEKDLPLALEVMKRVIEVHPSAFLVICGDGALAPELPERVSRLGLTERVRILGYQPATPQLYAALDVYLMTSKTEGLPNTLLEAMSCGRPSVATGVGGIPELVGSSQGATLLQPGDADGLAAAVQQLLTSPAEADRMGRAARNRIVESFSFTRRLQRIEAIYLRLLR